MPFFFVLFALLLIGIGLALALFVLLCAAGLMMVGVVSVSVLVGLRERSVLAGFATLVRIVCLLAGLCSGFAAAGITVRLTQGPDAVYFYPLLIGGVVGAAGGYLLGFIVILIVRRIIEIFVSLWGKGVSKVRGPAQA